MITNTRSKEDFNKLKVELKKKYPKLTDADFAGFEGEKQPKSPQDKAFLDMLEKKTGKTQEVIKRDLEEVCKNC